MTQKNLTIRVEKLESAVAELARLPRQMEGLSSQFLQLREDVREEISGVRGEMATMRDQLRGDVGNVQMELAGAILSTEKRLSTDMRSLHEDLVHRIALIGEIRPAVEEPGAVSPVRRRRSPKRR